MEKRPPQKISSEKQSFSVLQADRVFVKKILSRNSSGNHSSHLENFKAPAEVPFKWESRPGQPKEKSNFLHPLPPPEVDSPVSTPARETRVPRVSATGQEFSRTRVRHFLKKLIQKGHKIGVNFKNVDHGLPRSDHHRHRREHSDQHLASYVASSSSNSSFNNLGFSTASSSSSPISSANGYTLPLERSSKLRSFSRGCIKWVF